MRRVIAIMLLLLITVVGSGVSSVFGQSADDRIFESPQGGVRFLVPNRWTVTDGSADRLYVEVSDINFGRLTAFVVQDHCNNPSGALSCDPTTREALIYYVNQSYNQTPPPFNESSFVIYNEIEYLLLPDNQLGIKAIAPGYFVVLDWFSARDEAENALFRRVLETIELTGGMMPNEGAPVPPETIDPPAPEFEIPSEETGEIVEEVVEEIIPPEPVIPTPLQLLVNARIDLETLAGLTIGAQRPDGWTGNTNSSDPDLAITIRLDLETLARALIGEDLPAGWFGVIASSPYAIARDIRHDLELLADAVEISPRPANWAGASALLRCDRTTQALINLLEESTDFTLQADRTASDFCDVASIEATVYTERFLGGAFTVVPAVEASDPRVTAANAVGFIDLAGTTRGGIFPQGERVEVVARQSGDNAVLMLVRGVGFELFVDYRSTNVTQAQFLSLRGVGGMRVDPRCNASWCN